jgi:hypothetical protein
VIANVESNFTWPLMLRCFCVLRLYSSKNKTPFQVIYYEAYLDRKDATGREKFLKSGAGWRFIKKQLKNYFDNSGK